MGKFKVGDILTIPGNLRSSIEITEKHDLGYEVRLITPVLAAHLFYTEREIIDDGYVLKKKKGAH